MAVVDRVQSDVTTALKAGNRERAGALRLIVSESQKAVKDGTAADEVEVLQRERKRRLEKVKGRADGKRVSGAVKEKLTP